VHLDPDQSKSSLMAQLLELSPEMSPSRAGRLAAKIQRGDYSPRILQHADPTAERACNNVLRDAA
jgi:hypothetical protein